MTSWLAREAYSPLWFLAAGLVTFAGCLGVGRALLRGGGVRLPSPWEAVTSALLGVQLLGLGVQVFGVAAVATPSVLFSWILLFWLAGAWETTHAFRAVLARVQRLQRRDVGFGVAAALVATSVAVNLVLAIAPSTKADELYYHMLVPSRLVHDHALRFYLLPWEGAVVPQMGYQIAMAPLHAMLIPDAANVVSWGFATLLMWFAYRMLRNADYSAKWAALWCATVGVGLYGAVWHVTGGSHAMGELAIAALAVAVLASDSGWAGVPREHRAIAIGILASAGAISKLSTVPLAFGLLVAGVVQLSHGAASRDRLRIALAAVLPGMILWGPLVAWTWYVSGAPFGPVLSWWFPHSVYAGTAIREMIVRPEAARVVEFFGRHSPLLWFAALGVVVTRVLPPGRRALATVLVAGQALVILTLLTQDTRFLSGLPYGFAIVFACAASARIRDWCVAPVQWWLTLSLLVLPWIVVPAYYARPMARVVFGRQTIDEFLNTYVGFYADYRALDALLPSNAVLLTDFRLSSVYAPRMPVWSARDVSPGDAVYQFASTCDALTPAMVAADTVYYTPSAIINAFRTPGRAPETAPLCVRRLGQGR